MMKNLYVFLLSFALLSACTPSVSVAVFDLSPEQSMLMTGKGPGQDGAINPYKNSNSLGVVKNIGEKSFSIRVQEQAKVIEIITINPKETKEVFLKKSYQLYLDSDYKTRASVTFKKVQKDI